MPLDKKMAGLLGAVAALGTIASAQATPTPAPTDPLQAHSYADLLQPIPNAGAVLQAIDEHQSAATDTGNMQLAYHHHHHHHHHHYHRPRIVLPLPFRHRHHHHHHHHHYRHY